MKTWDELADLCTGLIDLGTGECHRAAEQLYELDKADLIFMIGHLVGTIRGILDSIRDPIGEENKCSKN